MRDRILKAFQETVEETGTSLRVEEITDKTVLLETGLDSLGFAILVTRLEEDLGYDPFVKLEHAVYPKTFGEFVRAYESTAREATGRESSGRHEAA